MDSMNNLRFQQKQKGSCYYFEIAMTRGVRETDKG